MGPRQARALVEARLGRPAQDALEAAIVLEAWGGFRATSALGMGDAVMSIGPGTAMATRPTDHVVWAEDESAREQLGVGFLLMLLALATWLGPLADAYGAESVERAWRAALPLSSAVQWILLRRYPGADGLGRQRRNLLPSLVTLGLGVLAAGALAGPSYLLAGGLVITWVCGCILVRRGWAVPFAATVAGASVALILGVPATPQVAAVAAVSLLGVAGALWTAAPSNRSATPWRRALLAGSIGGGVGLLLVLVTADHWEGAGAFPVLALFPCLIGSTWAGRHLSKLWTIVPGTLITTAISERTRPQLLRLAGGVVAGALVRMLFAMTILSAAMAFTIHQTGASLTAPLIALGSAGLVAVLASLLDGLGRQFWALAVVASACVAMEIGWSSDLVPNAVAAPLVPVAVAAVVALIPLKNILSNVDFTLSRSAI